METGWAIVWNNQSKMFVFWDSSNVFVVLVEWGMIRFVDFSRNSHGFRFLSIRINILRKFKFILDRKTLEKIYFTFVRPL
jgi:hypothetical protein